MAPITKELKAEGPRKKGSVTKVKTTAGQKQKSTTQKQQQVRMGGLFLNITYSTWLIF